MRSSSYSRRALRRLKTFATQERGYALILTSLILVPLMGFAGFAVDVGAWYSRAASLQRGSDAAALAGVVWQPDFATADAEARAAAARNGFIDGQDGVQVNVTNLGSNQLEVEIIDTDADMFFAGLFLDNVTIGRRAVAEYASAVPLGSPANVVGFGSQSIAGEAPSNAWTAMMGQCTNSSYGDLLSIASNNWSSSSDCGTHGSNPYHDDAGYQWVIDIPTASAVDINVFDYGSCKNSERSLNLPQNDDYNVDIKFTLYAPDNTPLTFDDNPQYGSAILGPDGAGCAAWTTLWTTDGTPGQWMMRTQVFDKSGDQTFDELPDDSGGTNYFSIWADSPASGSYCLTFADSNCPGVYAVDWMPVRTDPTGSPAVFYLAEVDIQHQDKTLVVNLWDPGEGMESMEILDPNGNAVDFTYSTAYKVQGTTAGVTNASPCTYSSYCLDVTNSVWNGQLVEIRIPLSGLAWSSFSNYWFRVRYALGGGTSVDWTTWGVEVVGDPVRLLE
jgi:putative Flp pilus-assembly TadE/G-like protein